MLDLKLKRDQSIVLDKVFNCTYLKPRCMGSMRVADQKMRKSMKRTLAVTETDNMALLPLPGR